MGSPPRSGRRVAAMIVGGVGLVLGLAGVAVTRFIPAVAAAEHARLAALPSPSAGGIGALPVGTEVLVEGRIPAGQPRRFRDFVAYVHEEEERDAAQRERRGRWKIVASVTPPLDVVTADGTVRVVDDRYAITAPSTRWHDTSRIIDTSYAGLVGNDTVFVHGRVATGGIDAIAVGSGTRAAHLETMAGQADIAWWLGVLFQAVGGVLLLIALGLRVWK